MNLTDQKNNRLIRYLPCLLFFVAGVFYLYLYTAYIFFYQEKSTLFLVSVPYLLEHLSQPGGFLTWLGELQTTFYYIRLAGAFLILLEVCGIVYLLAKTGKKLTGRDFYLLPFLIGAALFYLQTHYQYSAFNNLAILIQLALFDRVIAFKNGQKHWIVVGLFPLDYFLFGSFSALLLLMVTLYLLQKKQWLKTAVLWLWGAVFFFAGKEFLFFQTTETLLSYPFTVQDVGQQIVLFGITMAALVLVPVLFKIDLKVVNSLKIKNIQLVELTPFVIVAVLALLSAERIDKKNSHYFHVEDLFYRQQYDEVIRFNARFPSTNILTAYLNNVALAETGRLTDSFFRFPQSPDGGTLFLKWEIVGEVLKRGGYFYYSLGMINEAQRWAYEYMVMRGYTPEGLKMLIRTDLIKGNYVIAQKYISILKKSVFYRNEARGFEKLLFDDAAVDAHPELGRKKRLDIKQDFFVMSDNPAANLDLIIAADPGNMVAIEYKLAWLMLQKDMQGIVELLPLMERAGYKRIPKNVEEAVVAVKQLQPGLMPALERLQIDPQTEERFRQYYRIFQQNQGSRQQAQRALARDFSDTYWFYVFFN